jgi:signal transduction histidine kinase/DNA-binding NarL/FixJ family response regulator/HPt (histidine-containing phosphotransfer) domain-containing protein
MHPEQKNGPPSETASSSVGREKARRAHRGLLSKFDVIVLRSSIFILAMVVIGLTFRIVSADDQYHRMYAVSQEHAGMHAREFARELNAPTGAKTANGIMSSPTISVALREYVQADEHLLAAAVVDESERVLVYAEHGSASPTLRAKLDAAMSVGAREITEPGLRNNDLGWTPHPSALIADAVTVLPSGERVIVRMVMSTEIATSAWGSLVKQGMLFGAAVLVMSVLFVTFIARHPIRSLRESSTFARQLVTGKPRLLKEQRDGFDALLELRRALNDLSSELDRQRAQTAIHEKELREARDRAERATAAKSQFLASMSHEIRTPINGVLGMIDLSLDHKLTAQQRHYLTLARQSGDSLVHVINDILDMSKIEAGRMTIERVPFSLYDLIEEFSKPFMLRAAEKRIDLFNRVNPNLPARLYGDPFRLRQVLTNLVGNGLKFTEYGYVMFEADSVRPAITLQGATECEIRFVVRDTGPGIPAEQRQHVFEAFGQADSSTTRRFGGTGLGLTISASLVALMGGALKLADPHYDGEGALFTFTLNFPIDVDEEAPIQTDYERFDGLRVLWMDPRSYAREWFTEVLGRWGAEVQPAEDWREARLHMQQVGFDAVFVDFELLDLASREDIALLIDTQPDALFSALVGPRDSLPDCVSQARGTTTNATRDWQLLMKPISAQDINQALATSRGRTMPLAGLHEKALPSVEGLRVLVAEDNLVNQEVIIGALARMGVDATVVSNGKLAVEASRRFVFDVVLMDVQMPEMDGVTATQHIRRREQETGSARLPIIAMTAHALVGDRERFIEAGMDGYVSKPFTRDALASELARVAPDKATLLRQLVAQSGRTSTAGSDGDDQVAVLSASAGQQMVPDDAEFDRDMRTRFGPEPARIAHMAALFRTEVEKLIPPLIASYAEGAPVERARLLHSLRGMAAILNAKRIEELARTLHLQGNELQNDLGLAYMREIERELDLYSAWFTAATSSVATSGEAS